MSLSIKVSELTSLSVITSDDYIIVNDNTTTTTQKATFNTLNGWMSVSASCLSSSFASSSISSSYSLSSSYARNCLSSSYSLSGSYALTSSFSDYALNVPDTVTIKSASYALSSSYAVTSSYSISSSYARNCLSSSYAVTSSYVISSSYALSSSYGRSCLSSSYALSSSYGRSCLSSSYSLSSSYAVTSSYALAVLNPPASNIIVGTIIDFAGELSALESVYPGDTGKWAVCDGSALDKTAYATLFAIIGYTWGNPGGNNFSLPNLTRKVTVGKGGVATATLSNTIGSTGGTETHTLSESEIPSHYHSLGLTADSSMWTTYTGMVSWYIGNSTSIRPLETKVTGIAYDTIIQGTQFWGVFVKNTETATGGGSAHNNIQPTAVVNKLIRIA